MVVRQAQFVLEPDPRSVRVARALLRLCLADWSSSARLDDIAIVVSELVTNGVTHARTELVLAVDRSGQWLEISVADESPWPVQPRPRRPDPAADLAALVRTQRELGDELDDRDVRLDVGAAGSLVGGRGLLLVEAVADEWGVTPASGGKVVWARFAVA